MKGLFIKDFLTLFKQMKLFLIMIIIFAVIPNSALYSFALVYSVMMPITALAYDERSKWDTLAAMMPYSSKQIVLSKYILGMFLVITSALISVIGKLIAGVTTNTSITAEDMVTLAAIMCIALLMLSVNLPLMFKMGVEKGRMVFLSIFALGFIVLFLFNNSNNRSIFISEAQIMSFVSAGVIITVAAIIISAILSIRIYSKREI